ncbi:hypothetical protein Droror1_Dr00020563 [Drosera rotundifolia]
MHQRQRVNNNGKYCSRQKVAQMATGILGICVIGYIAGLPLYWHSAEVVAALGHSTVSSCSPCGCDCLAQPLLSIPEDCMRGDNETNKEVQKLDKELLVEELKQREAKAEESQREADVALLEAKKSASQYQKEAEKCNSGMETCEDAREKAEAAVEDQRKVTVMWEHRARQKGWKEDDANTRSQL